MADAPAVLPTATGSVANENLASLAMGLGTSLLCFKALRDIAAYEFIANSFPGNCCAFAPS